MRIRIGGLVLIHLLFITGFLFAEGNQEIVKLKGRILAHPVLNVLAVEIPSEGLFVNVFGKVRMMRKGSGDYIDVPKFVLVFYEDILEIRTGARIEIVNKDGSLTILGPFDQTKWYSFGN